MSCNLGNCCPFGIATRRQRCRFTLFSFMLPCAFYPLCSSSHSRLPRHPTSVSRCEIAICSQNSLIGLRIIDGCGGSAPPPLVWMTPARISTRFGGTPPLRVLRPSPSSVLLWTGPSLYGTLASSQYVIKDSTPAFAQG